MPSTSYYEPFSRSKLRGLVTHTHWQSQFLCLLRHFVYYSFAVLCNSPFLIPTLLLCGAPDPNVSVGPAFVLVLLVHAPGVAAELIGVVVAQRRRVAAVEPRPLALAIAIAVVFVWLVVW